MTRQYFFPLIITLIFLCSCSTNAIEELPGEQKEAITNEIVTLWENAAKGFEVLDATPLFSNFSESDEVKFISYGSIYTDIESVKKRFAVGFKSPDAYKRKVTWDTLYFDFLNDKVVIMTTIGSFESLNDTISMIQPIRAYTVLWIKESDGWKILNMHASKNP